MTDHVEIFDPTTAAFWAAAARGVLVVQRCATCAHSQLYPRPFCLNCDSPQLSWEPASGLATVYSSVTVHLRVRDDLDPPYSVGLVEIDEGPRLLARLAAGAAIGDRVSFRWLRAGPNDRPILHFDPVSEESR